LDAKQTKPPLDERIAKARNEAGLNPAPSETPMTSGRGASVGMELAVAVLAFAALGYGLDRWLLTKPWFMLLGLLLGFVVGMWNLYRLSTGADNLGVGIKGKGK
jgi:ATP synthase protein I